MYKAKFTMETTFLVKRHDLVLANNLESLTFVCKSIIFTSANAIKFLDTKEIDKQIKYSAMCCFWGHGRIPQRTSLQLSLGPCWVCLLKALLPALSTLKPNSILTWNNVIVK